ncbi:MAG: selenocysteine-specific translation elongation factor, partial [Pseudomonadota bacterium]
MIITLAGHVDHGKTSLVQALTGVNTDRLTEEKRRGLTIDLGFAYLGQGAERLGFVDVPGHHRFIHNMVAGVSADQHALLVIAADDGPMPQSLEHLQILDLIGIREGTVALTKCDRVTDEQRADARARTEALLANSCLAKAQIIETSITSGEGLEALRNRLSEAAVGKTARSDSGAFRMPIDRSFTISGAGVVVTGTVHNGAVQVDDTLRLFPEDREVRVKSIRAQDESAESASVGERVALNLAGVEQNDVRRGQWLTGTVDEASNEFSVSLKVLDDYPRSIRHWLPVHVYFATSHTTGHVALLSAERVAPGEEALVELVTSDKLLLRRGDRLVLRDQGLDRTLGGGRVVSVQPASGRRRADDRLARLSADRAEDPASSLAAHLDVGAVELDPFRRNWDLTDASLSELLAASGCREVAGHAIRNSTWQAWKQALQQDIEHRHQEDSALQGLT